MQILFTSKLEGEINSFQPYPFHQAVERTEELDTKWKKKNAEPVVLDFMISNDEGDKLYNGTYVVGSNDTTNIYDHVCRKLVKLPMKNEQQETERDILLQNLTSHTPMSYQLDVTELLKEGTSSQKGWKFFSKRQKLMAGSLAGLVVVTMVISISYVLMLRSQSQAMHQLNQELAEVKASKSVYETALTGDVTEAIEKLQAERERSDSEQKALVYLLLQEKNFEEAVDIAGKENLSNLAGKVMQFHGVEELQSFHKSFPSPVGTFEVSYHTEHYEKAIVVEDVAMTPRRYKEKGLAYLRLDQLQKAKKMASEAKSNVLNEKISTYEQLEQKLTQLNHQIETEKQADDQDQDKIKGLEKQRKALQKEQNKI